MDIQTDCQIHCFSHAMNLAVQDLLKAIKVSIDYDEENTSRGSALTKVCKLLISHVFVY